MVANSLSKNGAGRLFFHQFWKNGFIRNIQSQVNDICRLLWTGVIARLSRFVDKSLAGFFRRSGNSGSKLSFYRWLAAYR
jgi:hypothetical protein